MEISCLFHAFMGVFYPFTRNVYNISRFLFNFRYKETRLNTKVGELHFEMRCIIVVVFYLYWIIMRKELWKEYIENVFLPLPSQFLLDVYKRFPGVIIIKRMFLTEIEFGPTIVVVSKIDLPFHLLSPQKRTIFLKIITYFKLFTIANHLK